MKLLSCLLFLITIFSHCFSQSQNNSKPEIGIVGDFLKDSLFYNSGYHFLVESAGKLFSPVNVDDLKFEENLKHFKSMRTKIYALNIFMPGDLKLVGPVVDEQAIIKYSTKVFERCKMADVKLIVWGSGGARRIPDGFDHSLARKQFIGIAAKLATLAAQYDVILALENLNSRETNFITTVAEASEIVKAVNHPKLRLCIDIYHMMVEQEPAEVISQTQDLAAHCDIAELQGRKPPGTNREDFSAYLMALRKINYKGKIIIEAQWDDLSSQAASAYEYLRQQVDAVYRK
jgi:sugar phosphate isomerase/epimerase